MAAQRVVAFEHVYFVPGGQIYAAESPEIPEPITAMRFTGSIRRGRRSRAMPAQLSVLSTM